MNLKQKSYFIKRIDEISSLKMKAIRQDMELRFDTNVSRQKAWDDNKIGISMSKLMKVCRSKIGERSHYGMSTWQNINMAKFLRGHNTWEKKMARKQAKYDAKREDKRDACKAFATQLKDKCMFGSEEQAYRMMNEFIKKKF